MNRFLLTIMFVIITLFNEVNAFFTEEYVINTKNILKNQKHKPTAYLIDDKNIFINNYLLFLKNEEITQNIELSINNVYYFVENKQNFITKYSNKILLSGNYFNTIFLLNSDGEIIWEKNLANLVNSNPKMNDQYIAVSTLDKFYILDSQNGDTIFLHEFVKKEKSIHDISPLFIDNKNILFVENEKKILKFNLESKKIEKSYYFDKNLIRAIEKFYDGNEIKILVNTSNSIEILSKSLDKINEKKIYNIRNLKCFNSKIFTLLNDAIIIYDENLEEIDCILCKNCNNFIVFNENSDEYIMAIKRKQIKILNTSNYNFANIRVKNKDCYLFRENNENFIISIPDYKKIFIRKVTNI